MSESPHAPSIPDQNDTTAAEPAPIVLMSTDDLSAHPRNAQLYDDRQDPSFIESIAACGVLEPLVVNARTRQVVSGNRRLAAARAAGIRQVAVRLVTFEGNAHELTVLLSCNKYRRKTEAELTREYLVAREIEDVAARQRRSDGAARGGRRRGKQVSTSTPPCDAPSAETGKAVDRAAALVGLGTTKARELDYVRRTSPELFAAVQTGTTTIHRAYRQLRGASPKPTTAVAGKPADRPSVTHTSTDELGVAIDELRVALEHVKAAAAGAERGAPSRAAARERLSEASYVISNLALALRDDDPGPVRLPVATRLPTPRSQVELDQDGLPVGAEERLRELHQLVESQREQLIERGRPVNPLLDIQADVIGTILKRTHTRPMIGYSAKSLTFDVVGAKRMVEEIPSLEKQKGLLRASLSDFDLGEVPAVQARLDVALCVRGDKGPDRSAATGRQWLGNLAKSRRRRKRAVGDC